MVYSPVIYFHGIPGSPKELELFQKLFKSPNAYLFAPNRNSKGSMLSLPAYFDQLAGEINTEFPKGPLRFIGFSIGSYVALEVAQRLTNRVFCIDLVSAAAPLNSGDYIDKMAGKAIFRKAHSSKYLFSFIVFGQFAMAKLLPQYFFQLIFRSARGEDQAFVRDLEFRRKMIDMLLECLSSETYSREIIAYTSDWSALVSSTKQPIRLFHGSLDNWAPLDMAKSLARSLPNVIDFKIFDGKSHYSTLQQYLIENPL